MTTPFPDGCAEASTVAVKEIMLREPWRGQGIARLIHDDLLRDRSEVQVSLLVNALNGDGKVKALYESWGYEPISTHSRPSTARSSPPCSGELVHSYMTARGVSRRQAIVARDAGSWKSVQQRDQIKSLLIPLCVVETFAAAARGELLRRIREWLRCEHMKHHVADTTAAPVWQDTRTAHDSDHRAAGGRR